MVRWLENKIRRASERFSSIEHVDYSNNMYARLNLAYTARRLFDDYRDSFPYPQRSALNADSLPFKKTLAVVAETAEECAKVLGVHLPSIRVCDFGETSEALERVIIINGQAARIEINSRFITDTATGFTYGPDYPAHREKRALRELTAQEVYHLKIMQQYPATHRRTESANRSVNAADYDNDIGERATSAFGDSYARYKSGHETYPERITDL